MTRSFSRTAAGIVIGGLVLAASSARADHGMGALVAAAVGGTVVVSAFEIGNLVVTIHNGVYAGRGDRPTNGWLAAGYTFGLLNIVGGVALLTAAGTAGLLSQVGGIALGLGALNLGLTLWAHTRPEKATTTRLSLAPIVGTDRQGGLFGGVGIRLAAF